MPKKRLQAQIDDLLVAIQTQKVQIELQNQRFDSHDAKINDLYMKYDKSRQHTRDVAHAQIMNLLMVSIYIKNRIKKSIISFVTSDEEGSVEEVSTNEAGPVEDGLPEEPMAVESAIPPSDILQ